MVGHVTRAGALAAAVGITAACASTAGLRSAPLDAGETKFYSQPLAVVGPAARQAVLSVGLNVDTVSTPDSLTWMIIAKKGMSCLATNITARGDWSGKIYEQLDHILAAH